MTFKGPGGFGRIVNIIITTFMSVAFSTFMLWVMQQRVGDAAQIFTPLGWVTSFITAFGIGYVTADLIPVYKAGSFVAKKLGLKGMPAYLVTVLVIDLILTSIISFFMTFINMAERAGIMGAIMSWLQMLPIMLLIGFVVQFIIMKPAMIIAKKASGFDPDNPMPPMGMMPPAGGPTGPGGPGGSASPGGPGR